MVGPSQIRIAHTLPRDAWPVLRDFFATHYRDNHAILSRDLFHWQYRCQDGGDPTLISAWLGERLVGVLGYLAVPSFWGDWQKPLDIAWAMNWMVDPDHRTGVGWAMLRKLEDLFPVILSIDASPANIAMVERLGWRVNPYLGRKLLILDEATLVRDWRLTLTGVQVSPPDMPEGTARLLTESDNDYAPRWPLYEPCLYGSVRSWDFLRWRYFTHPRHRYQVALAGPGDRPAVCAWRIEHAFDPSGAFVGSVARVADFFHPSDRRGRADARSLLAAVAGWWKREGCLYADFVITGNEYADTLAQQGWIAETAEQTLLPSRLMPVQHIHKPLNYEIGVRRGVSVPAEGQLQLSRGDCDADMPGLLDTALPPEIRDRYDRRHTG